jgi:methylenetetrahydrofolate reductase (NADPH)
MSSISVPAWDESNVAPDTNRAPARVLAEPVGCAKTSGSARSVMVRRHGEGAQERLHGRPRHRPQLVVRDLPGAQPGPGVDRGGEQREELLGGLGRVEPAQPARQGEPREPIRQGLGDPIRGAPADDVDQVGEPGELDRPPAEPISASMRGEPIPLTGPAFDLAAARRLRAETERLLTTLPRPTRQRCVMSGVSADRLHEVLDSPIFATVATIQPDGTPQQSVVWVERDGDDVLFMVGIGSRKERNLRRDPRASVLVCPRRARPEGCNRAPTVALAWPTGSARTAGSARSANRLAPMADLAVALRRVSYEVLPLKRAEEAVVAHVPLDVPLTVSTSHAKGPEPTVDLAVRLAGHGYSVTPHLAARQIRGGAHLSDLVAQLSEAGVDSAFVIGGDAPAPAGPFGDALALLTALDEIGHPFQRIGIAGYPEGHARIETELLDKALDKKAPYATHVITQICFDAAATVGWARQVKERGVGLPIRVGLPGVVSRQKLVRISAGLGLGQSARFLLKQQSMFWRFFLPGGYHPGRLAGRLAPHLHRPATHLDGFHFFTFNEVASTEAWRRSMLARSS